MSLKNCGHKTSYICQIFIPPNLGADKRSNLHTYLHVHCIICVFASFICVQFFAFLQM